MVFLVIAKDFLTKRRWLEFSNPKDASHLRYFSKISVGNFEYKKGPEVKMEIFKLDMMNFLLSVILSLVLMLFAAGVELLFQPEKIFKGGR